MDKDIIAPAQHAHRHLTLNSFQVDDLLGEGNYSRVHAATLRPTQERYALKVVDRAKMNRHKKADEVLVEKWVLSALRHPTLLRLFHTFQDRASLYLVLEYIGGGELWSVAHASPLRPSLAAYYVASLVGALQFLHERGIVHRDIKPENVLLTEEGRLKLIDFGTAKLMPAELAPAADAQLLDGRPQLSSGGKFKEFVGTPEYMPPEQINNKPTDFRSDLWSLGCFTCQLLSGEPPFRGGSEYLTMKRVLACAYNMPDAVERDAADFIRRLLSLDPSMRLGGGAPITAPATQRHGALWGHPFVARSLSDAGTESVWLAAPPVATLAELAAPLVASAVAAGGEARARMRGPSPSEWADGVRRIVAAELAKARPSALTDEWRAVLGVPPLPPAIDDQDFLNEVSAGDDGKEGAGSGGEEGAGADGEGSVDS